LYIQSEIMMRIIEQTSHVESVSDSSTETPLKSDKKYPTLEVFMKPFTLDKNSNEIYTHTSLGGMAGGKFAVPAEKMNDFFDTYHNEVFGRERDCCLTEANCKITQIKVDLDFRYVTDDGSLKRIYDMDSIVDVVRLYVKHIHKYLYVSKNNMVVFIMEKAGPSFDKKRDLASGHFIVRDGIHIMFPGIVTHSRIAHKIRDGVLTEIGYILDKYHFINDYKNIVDEAVIDRNNWFLYGSTKPNQTPYLVTKALRYELSDANGETANVSSVDTIGRVMARDIPVTTYSSNDYVRLFSILGKDKSPWKNAVRHEYLHLLEPEGDLVKSEYERRREESRNKRNVRKNVKCKDDELEVIPKLVGLLDPIRATEYKPWVELGWCLHNLHTADDTLLNVWIEFSKKAPQYADIAENECRDRWGGMREDGLGLGTLIHWVKNDNMAGYKRLMDDNISFKIRDFIKSNKLEHNDIGKIYYGMYRHTYIAICKSKSKFVWYEFKDHRWAELGSHSKLRKELSDQLSHAFTKQGEYFQNLASVGGPADANYLNYIEFTNRANSVAKKLKSCSFKDNVIKECQDEFVDEAKNFIEKLDENPDLIGCINGIYDLKRLEFRDGRPDDLVSMSTKTEYDDSITWSDPRVVEIMNFIRTVIPNDNVREYVMYIFASCLDGYTKREKMYVFSGSGGNGKSKLIELLDKAVGEYSMGVPISLLTKKRADSNAAQPELARTKGSRIIKFQEAEENSKINVGLMKELTGGDKIMCRALFSDPIEFKPQFTPFLICNDKPELPPHDDGTWRRVRLIEFKSKFVPDEADVDPSRNIFLIDYDISNKINTWGEPFLWILIEYYKKFKANGGTIRDPPEVMAYTNSYKMKNDIFNGFMDECVVKDYAMNAVFYLNDAYQEYKKWFRDNYSGQKPKRKEDLREYLIRRLGKEYDPNECIHKTANQKAKRGTCWLGHRLEPYYASSNDSTGGDVNSGGVLNLLDELDS